MSEQYQAIYQSGQKVLVDGLYEAVAARVPTVSQLTTRETFPNHDGRAICWHLLNTELHLSDKDNAGHEKALWEDDMIYGGMYS
jgi:hypothetical protein